MWMLKMMMMVSKQSEIKNSRPKPTTGIIGLKASNRPGEAVEDGTTKEVAEEVVTLGMNKVESQDNTLSL